MSETHDSSTAYLEDRPVLSVNQSRALSVTGPLLLVLCGLAICSTRQIDRLENVSIDWRFSVRGPLPPRSDIVIVEIDEASRRELRGGLRRFELREHLPAAIENLIDAGALVIAMDFWLDATTTPETDEKLAETISQTDVILAALYTNGKVKRAAPIFLESQPVEGAINADTDPDGVLRHLPAHLYLDVVGDDGEIARIPHFPLVVALYCLWEEDPTLQIEFTDEGAWIGERSIANGELIDFCAARGQGWRTLSFADAALGRFDADLVRRAVVLIGESRMIADSFTMPLAESLTPGMYYHANVAAQILDGRRLETSLCSGAWRSAVVGLLTFAAGLFAWNQRRWWMHRRSTLLLILYVGTGLLVFLGGWSLLAVVLFGRGVVLPLVGPLVSMAIALATGLVVQWIVVSANTRRLAERARRIEALFGQSVSQSVLEALRADPRAIVETHVREVSVLFCDLRHFTATAEALGPLGVAKMLNEYFDHVAAAVFEEDGFLDKFVGDEIMAVFSAPLPQPDHADRALRAAVKIKHRLADLNEVRRKRGEVPLDCGIGVHTGPAAAGHIGAEARSNYTVVGDTVNLAARIESLTKGGEILISETCKEHLADGSGLEFWKTVELRGATGKHNLYTPTG